MLSTPLETCSRVLARHERKRQNGVSLIEVLVAIVILSFGLLGLAGLQMTALRSNQSALERSTVVMEAYSILDAMRSNPQATKDGEFNVGFGPVTGGSGFAEQQIFSWRNRLMASLGPAATGSIDCSEIAIAGLDADVSPTACTVIIRWDDSRGLIGSSTQSFTTEATISAPPRVAP
ncbi:MAG: type IV pilus modification protein PilV [Rhodocyclaceae bacterium]